MGDAWPLTIPCNTAFELTVTRFKRDFIKMVVCATSRSSRVNCIFSMTIYLPVDLS